MKRVWILAFGAVALSFSACKKDSSEQSVGEVLNDGKWRVSYFYDQDHDETSDFAGYEFTFNDGTITASNGTNTVTGTYSEIIDSHSPKFIIDVNSGVGPFDELDDDWDVLEKTATQIKLKEVSGGSGETEYLNFSKI